jgi:cytochrome c oxidase subunit I
MINHPSMEITGRLRGGRGLFGWIAALPWERPMVLATGLSFVMLFFGGGSGLVNMGYGLNALIHNTSWVTAHFHLIFGGAVAVMSALCLPRVFFARNTVHAVAVGTHDVPGL